MKGITFLNVVDLFIEFFGDWVYDFVTAFVVLSDEGVSSPDFYFCLFKEANRFRDDRLCRLHLSQLSP